MTAVAPLVPGVGQEPGIGPEPGWWRLAIRHVTGYTYTRPVTASYNELRLTPRTSARQVTLDSRVEVRPAARLRPYTDYWGSVVHAFDVHHAHTRMEIVGTSVVDTAPVGPPPGGDPEWADLRLPWVVDRFGEYLAPTQATPRDAVLVRVARFLASGTRPAEAPDAVGAWAREHLEYSRGSTGVHTSAIEAWRAGRGVCQDFAHITLVLLRSMGVPARYVSGYVHPRPDAPVGETVVGESHAWVEAWTGGEWVGHDPTNGRPVGPDHVLVATGRDYDDVAPVHGVYAGGGPSSLDVTVEVTRLR